MSSRILALFLPIIAGYLGRASGYLPQNLGDGLRQLIVKMTLPALVLYTFASGDSGGSFNQFAPMVFALFPFFLSFWLVSLPLNLIPALKKHRVENSLILTFGNIGYIGWPVIEALLGADGLSRAIYFNTLWWPCIILFTAIIILINPGNSGVDYRKLVIDHALPSLAALSVGLLCRYTIRPEPDNVFFGFLRTLGGMTQPLILLSLGISISIRRSLAQIGRALPVVCYRYLIALPCALFVIAVGSLPFIANNLGALDDLSRQAIKIEAFMPTAVTTLIIGDMLKLDRDYIAALLAFSTLSTLLIVPFLTWFIRI